MYYTLSFTEIMISICLRYKADVDGTLFGLWFRDDRGREANNIEQRAIEVNAGKELY